MKEGMKHFANEGFGWYCLDCEAARQSEVHISRIMTEGESESKNPKLSASLAQWADPEKSLLRCLRCGVTESTAD